MDKSQMSKAAVLMVCIVAVSILCWELYLRKKGNQIFYDDGPALWADKRDHVYDKATTVFIGSSRIKYDLDIDTWRRLTGENAAQLAMQGTSPRPILDDLANDNNFNGRLIIDVTEILFFGASPGRQAEVDHSLSFYKKNHTPSQKASFLLNKELESHFVFLDKESFSAAALLDEVGIPNRPGVFKMPIFPRDFDGNTFDRQSYMTSRFVADTNLQNRVKGIWKMMGAKREAPPRGDTLLRIFASVKNATDKIKARGGTVLFVRTPSSGPFLAGETQGFPRTDYWDALLAYTRCPGIHFMDYPAIAHFQCPEFSHLSRPDAVIYTKNLVNILATKNGWKFPNEIQPAIIN